MTPPRARTTDPETSHFAAPDNPTRLAQRLALLRAYRGSSRPLCDADAAARAGLTSEDGAWKRCSDLRAEGLVEFVLDSHGHALKVGGPRGRLVRISRITAAGRAYLRGR
ncbi:hypothetical protein SEA_PUPPER_49 [Gordonia phage Pupper]|uniref:Helix-turn-helix DNA binding domain protein n=1 Tax=Gordonia phage Pupper TaxID=2571249 RepID=A0A4Y6EKG8_9CAUD|nr:hypothetical protein KHQ83_gp228 [Gordonia phage Pupper]QDF18535.1 hypothetical protein SEA_PUPPER_49 [Gordonia phage Pupper]QDF18768.1 hypothetical protein SEA_SCENTAE_49 [Gordonia phage SCentae]